MAPLVRVVDDYVSTGSRRLTLDDASSFAPGDFVGVRKTVNQQWIDDLGSGHIESPDAPVQPASLFEQQLVDRIGRERAMAVLAPIAEVSE